MAKSSKNLVIVESPAKVKTIKKFLGANYTIVASAGHVRDLPKSRLGIKIDEDYEPEYITIRGKGEILAMLRKEVKKADHIYLATDPDREGEAISWHLATALKLEGKDVHRISFNEITKKAVTEAIKNPRDIDMNLVDAQQSRRVLDRMVGYTISPLLWEKIKRGLSAGRVQSVALRLVCDRENEIQAFIPKEYWTCEGTFVQEGKAKSKPVTASYYGGTKKEEIPDKATLDKILADSKKGEFVVSKVKKEIRSYKSPLPFTTSSMQQEASKALNFAPAKTMRIAQQLYEGVDIEGHGQIALITYLRTDSTRIADEALEAAKDYITENYGADYVGEVKTAKKNDVKVQDAHEAIRPVDITLTPAIVKDSLQRDQYRLYQLIWKRFVAACMSSSKYENLSVRISNSKVTYQASSSKIVFSGFKTVYTDFDEEKLETNAALNHLSEGDVLKFESGEGTQHFTQPPAHFTEASLIKALEELGIGRPSTYAPTVSTLTLRHYLLKEEKSLYVTELGEAVNNIMVHNFSTIVDVNFTANMEALLDKVEEGTIKWKTIVKNFYPDLKAAVDEASKNLENVVIADEVSDVLCEDCGVNMVIKYGPHGKFLACPNFPNCRNTKVLLEKIGEPCPLCGKDLVVRKTKKGRRYYGCEGYPDCEYMSWTKPSMQKAKAE